jgi:DNA polymerase III psi subunit
VDAQTRHWYLQQMGIPVWVPKGSETALEPPEQMPAAMPSPLPEKAAGTSPGGQAKAGGLSPAQQIAQSLRGESSGDNTVAAGQTEAFWLVLPNVPDQQRAEAEALLDKVLAAVEVDKSQCYLLWAMPTQLPPSSVKHLWCFGLQAPPGVAAKALELPSLADMLSNVDAKRAAWSALKAAMPFNC